MHLDLFVFFIASIGFLTTKMQKAPTFVTDVFIQLNTSTFTLTSRIHHLLQKLVARLTEINRIIDNFVEPMLYQMIQKVILSHRSQFDFDFRNQNSL
jgi:hypothetical protein